MARPVKRCPSEVVSCYQFNAHAWMYTLKNGLIIHREERVNQRHGGYKYAVFLPGGDPSGCAKYLDGANRLTDVITKAGKFVKEVNNG